LRGTIVFIYWNLFYIIEHILKELFVDESAEA